MHLEQCRRGDFPWNEQNLKKWDGIYKRDTEVEENEADLNPFAPGTSRLPTNSGQEISGSCARGPYWDFAERKDQTSGKAKAKLWTTPFFVKVFN